jgi:hypothetical protein
MKLSFIEEPYLQFGQAKHICPKYGITNYHTYDYNLSTRPEKIRIGVVGKSESIETILQWLEETKNGFNEKENNNKPKLFPRFDGFKRDKTFMAELV